jgi:ATP-binding cassette subfamily F protein uup
LRQRKAPTPEAPAKSSTSGVAKRDAVASKPSAAAIATPKKLSYRDQRELDQLPAIIEQLESEQAALHEEMAAPGFYKQPGDQIAARQAALRSVDDRLAAAYSRWEHLESAANAG